MRAKSIILIIAVILILGGLIMSFAALASTGFDWRRISQDGDTEQKRFDTEASGIREIIVRERNREIILEPSVDGKIHIIYFESEKETYRIRTDDGKLTIEVEDRRRWFDFIGIHIETQSTTIQIPAEFSGDVDLDTKNGDVDVSDLAVKGKVKLSTSNGGILAEGLTVGGDFDADTSNGRISADNVTVGGGFDASTKNGQIELAGVIIEGEAYAKSSNSSITVKDVAARVLTLDTSNGSIRLSGVDVAEKLDCHSSNGSIRGTVKGRDSDFRITSKTSNGRNNLPASYGSGPKEMLIKSSNGSIDIQFE